MTTDDRVYDTMSMPMQPSRGANTGRLDARVSYSIRDRVVCEMRYRKGAVRLDLYGFCTAQKRLNRTITSVVNRTTSHSGTESTRVNTESVVVHHADLAFTNHT